jgi:hypothetical protein
MKICPSCREEYLDHIELCYSCKETLMSAEEAQMRPHTSGKLLSKEELLREVTVPLVEGGLVQCREMEKVLKNAQISSAVFPVNLGCDDHGSNKGGGCAVKYMVLIRESDIGACKLALEGQFLAQVAKEGQGHFVPGTIDLNDQEISCPACGEHGALNQGECASCGLFLGETEGASQKN